MKVSDYVLQEDAEVEASSDLVSRVERRKKANADHESSLFEQALTVENQIEIHAATLLKETARKDAKKVVMLAGVVQGLTVKETGEILKTEMEIKREKVACSEVGTSEAATSEATATRGNSQPHTIYDSIINLDSTSSPSTNSKISLTPSPSNQTHKKPVDDVFVPVYPYILERICNMAQMRIDACQNLPANHPLQPPYIQPLQIIFADEQCARDFRVSIH